MQGKRKGFIEGIAEERIRILFGLAEEFCSKNPERSKQYIELALRIASRNKAKMPLDLKVHYCKKCNCFLGKKNSSLNEEKKPAVLKCKSCGFERKLGFKAES
ncbi:MAG: hypothetical protein Q7R70_06775 [Candidatus Diapherotrites archaeon]|nr:hypothetical protein [Candidatus Diapherotrites archaeon]